jgi:hypothetical protein
MSIASIQTALVAHLKTLSTLPTLQEENSRFAPKSTDNYSRVTLLPAQPQQISVGTTGKDLLTGLLQVDIFVTLDSGIDAGNALADAVIAHFPRGQIVSHDNTSALCQRSWRQTAGRFNTHYQIPVVVQWASII